jgi:hypothetical protein
MRLDQIKGLYCEILLDVMKRHYILLSFVKCVLVMKPYSGQKKCNKGQTNSYLHSLDCEAVHNFQDWYLS